MIVQIAEEFYDNIITKVNTHKLMNASLLQKISK